MMHILAILSVSSTNNMESVWFILLFHRKWLYL